jgi:protein SCO1/2
MSGGLRSDLILVEERIGWANANDAADSRSAAAANPELAPLLLRTPAFVCTFRLPLQARGAVGLFRSLAAAAVLLSFTAGASARITPEDYQAVGVTLPRDAAVPLSAPVRDESGAHHVLGDLVTRPSVLVLADYACRTLCGPAVEFVASALAQSGLSATQFRLIVIGLDPHATPSDVAQMRRAHGGDGDNIIFLTADAPVIASLTSALGYRYRYDADARQFIHPAAAYVLRRDGKVSRVLSELGLTPHDLRLALVEAGEGRIGSLGDQVRLICSAFDPQHGIYTLAITRVLAGAGAVTALLVAGGIGLLAWGGRRAA